MTTENEGPLPVQMATNQDASDEVVDMLRYLVTTLFTCCPETLEALNEEGYTITVSTLPVAPGEGIETDELECDPYV